MQYLWAILSTLAGAGAAVLMLVILAACAPNSTPKFAAQLGLYAKITAAAGGIGLIGSIVSMFLGKAPLATVFGVGMIVVSVTVFICLWFTEGARL